MFQYNMSLYTALCYNCNIIIYKYFNLGGFANWGKFVTALKNVYSKC